MHWGRSVGTLWVVVLAAALVGCGASAPADAGVQAPGGNGNPTAGDTDYLTLVDPAGTDDPGQVVDEPTGGGDDAAPAPSDRDETGSTDAEVVEPTPAEVPDETPVDAGAVTGGGSGGGGSGGGEQPVVVEEPTPGENVGDPLTIDADGHATPEQILAALQALPPLPKRHHYAPSNYAFAPEWDAITRQIVRITRSSGLGSGYGDWWTRKAVEAAAQANAAEPDALPAVLSTHLAPWLVEYKQHPHAVDDFGADYLSGLNRLQTFLDNQRAWIDQANQEFGTNIQFGHFALEIELWDIPYGGDPVWEAALLRRHNECYDMIKAVFPEASISWFDRGGIHRTVRLNGMTAYGETPRYTHLERGDNASTWLYSLMDTQDCHVESVRRTIENVDHFYGAGMSIVPWVALGAGYGMSMENPIRLKWRRLWDYPAVHSYRLGMWVNLPEYSTAAEIAAGGADWTRVSAVFFFPELIDHKITTAQNLDVRLRQFVAYVCGATRSPFPTEIWPNEP